MQMCGSITPDIWPGVERLELYNKMPEVGELKHKRRLRERLGHCVKDQSSMDLIDALLVLDPTKR